jgi:hypothetical protein
MTTVLSLKTVLSKVVGPEGNYGAKDVTRGFIVLVRRNRANKRVHAGMRKPAGGYDLFG